MVKAILGVKLASQSGVMIKEKPAPNPVPDFIAFMLAQTGRHNLDPRGWVDSFPDMNRFQWNAIAREAGLPEPSDVTIAEIKRTFCERVQYWGNRS